MHNNLRARFDADEPDVVDAMGQFADLANQAKSAVTSGNPDKLGPLLDANFDLRNSICQIAVAQSQMVQAARDVGASAKFAGSGGAIIGTYADEKMYDQLVDRQKGRSAPVTPGAGRTTTTVTAGR